MGRDRPWVLWLQGLVIPELIPAHWWVGPGLWVSDCRALGFWCWCQPTGGWVQNPTQLATGSQWSRADIPLLVDGAMTHQVSGPMSTDWCVRLVPRTSASPLVGGVGHVISDCTVGGNIK